MKSARLALLILLTGMKAGACIFASEVDVSFSPDNYVLYGEVVEHVSMPVKYCGRIEPSQCPPAWGARIKILQPIQVPAREVSTVDYFEPGPVLPCELTHDRREDVESKWPIGTWVGLAARLYSPNDPGRRPVRLTGLDPPLGTAIFVIPAGSDLRKLAETRFDYASFYRANSDPARVADRWPRINFEIGRDKLRLRESTNEREAMEDLLRIAAIDPIGGYSPEDDYYSPLEQLVDRNLPTTSLRKEFARRLPDAQYDGGVLNEEQERAVGERRARAGDAQAMYDFSESAPPEIATVWLRRSAQHGFLPAVLEFAKYADHEIDEGVEKDAARYMKKAKSEALRNAKRNDPASLAFLSGFYSNLADRETGDQQARDRKTAEHYGCLLTRQPNSLYWRYYFPDAAWYTNCKDPGSAR